MTTFKKPEKVEITYKPIKNAPDIPWVLKMSIPGHGHEGRYPSRESAEKYAENYKFMCPTWQEVTCNGKYGCN